MSNKHATSQTRRFIRSERGNIAMTFGLMILPMVGAIGAAIDFSRAVHAHSKMQAATDAAATAAAGATDATSLEKVAIAKDFFNNNMQGSFNEGAAVDVVVNGNDVLVTASGDVPAGFTKLFGVENIPVATSSQAGTGGKNLEVAMMIDITGSMGSTRNGMRKIDALQLAADDLLDIFFPNGAQTSGQVKVAIAPFADYVNAGEYASAVTGLPTTGEYANLTNLRRTKQGPSSGNYSGTYGNNQPLGSQFGATPLNASVLPGQAPGAQAGQTFASDHCSNPNLPGVNVSQLQITQRRSCGRRCSYNWTGPAGYRINDGSNNPPPQLMQGEIWDVDGYDNHGGSQGWQEDDTDPDYRSNATYIPIPSDVQGVQYVQVNGYDIGVRMDIDNSNNPVPPQIKRGYFREIDGWHSNGNWDLDDIEFGYYLPVPVSMQSGGGIDPNCTGTDAQPDQPAGQLISCVTERIGSDRYTDEAPGNGAFIGPYNQAAPGKTTNKLNYSEDGKCYTAGRELPAIIPLTNNRDTLDDFFASKSIGGTTPGHLGTAWAWYMLSPKWSSIWPAVSTPAEYDDETVMKAAIIMTDGEYNKQYSDATSRNQALALCQGMRDAGITVYTIGFGFSSSSADTTAANMLKQCVNNDSNSYFFPYDATELREAFADIGRRLTGQASKLVVMK